MENEQRTWGKSIRGFELSLKEARPEIAFVAAVAVIVAVGAFVALGWTLLPGMLVAGALAVCATYTIAVVGSEVAGDILNAQSN